MGYYHNLVRQKISYYNNLKEFVCRIRSDCWDNFLRPCFAQHAAVGPATIECWLKVSEATLPWLRRSDTETLQDAEQDFNPRTSPLTSTNFIASNNQHISDLAQETATCWHPNLSVQICKQKVCLRQNSLVTNLMTFIITHKRRQNYFRN